MNRTHSKPPPARHPQQQRRGTSNRLGGEGASDVRDEESPILTVRRVLVDFS
jgi:hypothetical protein